VVDGVITHCSTRLEMKVWFSKHHIELALRPPHTTSFQSAAGRPTPISRFVSPFFFPLFLIPLPIGFSKQLPEFGSSPLGPLSTSGPLADFELASCVGPSSQTLQTPNSQNPSNPFGIKTIVAGNEGQAFTEIFFLGSESNFKTDLSGVGV
jgi:hypothetical protein